MNLDRRRLLAGGAGPGQASQMQAAGRSSARGAGTIAIEEACLPLEVLADWERIRGRQYSSEWRPRLTDIHGHRLEEMDRFGIEMQVISLTVPGPQGDPNPVSAQDAARRGNDALAKAVAKRTDRFAAFGALAMHDVEVACREFERVVRELGMRGVLLNNYQRDGGSLLFYDDRRFDPFWDMAQKLDVPVYLHPYVAPEVGERRLDFEGFDWLDDAAWTYAIDTGLHALRIVTSGVFDRFPKAQLILGHMGEHIVYDMWRIGNRLRRQPEGCPAENEIRHYFRNNVHITTSGEFTDHGLRHAINEIGADRILLSIDYPFESNEVGTSWFAAAAVSDAERQAIGRGNAIRLLRLPLRS